MNQYLVLTGKEELKDFRWLAWKNIDTDLQEKIFKFKQEIDDKYHFIWKSPEMLCTNTYRNFTGSEFPLLGLMKDPITCTLTFTFKYTKQETLEVCISRDVWTFAVDTARRRIEKSCRWCDEFKSKMLLEFDSRVKIAKQQLQFYKCFQNITLIAFRYDEKHEMYSLELRDLTKRLIKPLPNLPWLKMDETEVQKTIASFFKHDDVLPANVFQHRDNIASRRKCVYCAKFYTEIKNGCDTDDENAMLTYNDNQVSPPTSQNP
jgi:hypothetical protein